MNTNKEFNDLCKDMIKALEDGDLPPKEAYPVLHEQFANFPFELQALLVDMGIVKKQRCEVWSRVMGYLRPVDQWNVGKKQEHREREHFTLKNVDKVINDKGDDDGL